jgi:hypothetical protein
MDTPSPKEIKRLCNELRAKRTHHDQRFEVRVVRMIPCGFLTIDPVENKRFISVKEE